MPTEEELRNNPEKYAMGENLQTTKHHPYGKGAAKLSPEELVRRGHEAHRNYAHAWKELNELANTTHKRSFREAADLALERAHREGDFKKDCRSCGKRHEYKERKEEAWA